jgi:hypothetical protein
MTAAVAAIIRPGPGHGSKRRSAPGLQQELRDDHVVSGFQMRDRSLQSNSAAVLDRAIGRVEPSGGFSARALAAKRGHSLEDSYDAFMDALASRPEAVVIDASSIDDAYGALVRYLSN